MVPASRCSRSPRTSYDLQRPPPLRSYAHRFRFDLARQKAVSAMADRSRTRKRLEADVDCSALILQAQSHQISRASGMSASTMPVRWNICSKPRSSCVSTCHVATRGERKEKDGVSRLLSEGRGEQAEVVLRGHLVVALGHHVELDVVDLPRGNEWTAGDERSWWG